MPVLKQQSTRPLIKDAIVLNLGDLSKQAAALRAKAEVDAKRIVEAAEAEAARLTAGVEEAGREAGYAAGHAEGLEQGREAGHAEALEQGVERAAAVAERWGALADEWEARRDEMDREAREAVLDLALRLAAKVVHRVIEVDQEVVTGQVAAALELVMSPADVVVRVHPEDRAAVQDVLPSLAKRFAHLRHLTLTEDEAVDRGGCVLTFGEGGVDATVETQLRRIAELIAPEPSGSEP